MKIGIFDSGLGGLIVARSLIQALPQYDYVYLGDTARLPYGNRSHDTVFDFTRQAVDFLFAQDCWLIIVACNTASAEALRRIQREYLPSRYPGRRVLGVLVPAAEAAAAATKSGHVGLIGTTATVSSGTFDRELHKLAPSASLQSQATPLLVPLVEYRGQQWARSVLEAYLGSLSGIDTLILGCTHYPYFKEHIRDLVGDSVALISQDEVMPPKLTDYLRRHPEVEQALSRHSTRRWLVTDLTADTTALAHELFGEPLPLEAIKL